VSAFGDASQSSIWSNEKKATITTITITITIIIIIKKANNQIIVQMGSADCRMKDMRTASDILFETSIDGNIQERRNIGNYRPCMGKAGLSAVPYGRSILAKLYFTLLCFALPYVTLPYLALLWISSKKNEGLGWKICFCFGWITSFWALGRVY